MRVISKIRLSLSKPKIEYKPVIRVASTVKPSGDPSFNDVFGNLKKELNYGEVRR